MMMTTRTTWCASLLALALTACATTPGANPHDMSAAQHENEATKESAAADAHATQFDPDAKDERTRCTSGSRVSETGGACWTSTTNPTAEHNRVADEHRKRAADHRAASAALRDAEAKACGGISTEDRDTSPFDHFEDVASVAPLYEDAGNSKQPSRRVVGAIVTFRAVPGMTAEWTQRLVDCHLARNAALGHVVPEMPDCPLVPNHVTAAVTSTGAGFAVAIRSSDADVAKEVLARAQRLRASSSAVAGR
jgi:hypothetical protein